MKDKLFGRILIVIAVLGMASVIALGIYSFMLYRDCSVISYIANRG